MINLIAQEFSEQPGTLWTLGQVGIITAITGTFAMLHRSAVNAYKEVANIERKRADMANAQLMQLLVPLKKAGDAHHET